MERLSARPDASQLNRAAVEAELHRRLLSWRELLDANVTQARQMLKTLL